MLRLHLAVLFEVEVESNWELGKNDEDKVNTTGHGSPVLAMASSAILTISRSRSLYIFGVGSSSALNLGA